MSSVVGFWLWWDCCCNICDVITYTLQNTTRMKKKESKPCMTIILMMCSHINIVPYSRMRFKFEMWIRRKRKRKDIFSKMTWQVATPNANAIQCFALLTFICICFIMIASYYYFYYCYYGRETQVKPETGMTEEEEKWKMRENIISPLHVRHSQIMKCNVSLLQFACAVHWHWIPSSAQNVGVPLNSTLSSYILWVYPRA